MKHLFILLLLLLINGSSLFAQVGISTDSSSPDPSAMLDIKSTSKGLLLPRMTTSQISLIASPADGLLVYNTDNSNLYLYVSSAAVWKEMTFGSGTINPPFVDPRDGQAYPVVQIGTQIWMQKNLNYPTANSWCYNNDPSNCAVYGRLYDWDAAMSACPSGWHLPTKDEYTILQSSAGWYEPGCGLREVGSLHWYPPNGCSNNSTGFTALGAGYYYPGAGFYALTQTTRLLTSSEVSPNEIYFRYLNSGAFDFTEATWYKGFGYSVRCLKD